MKTMESDADEQGDPMPFSDDPPPPRAPRAPGPCPHQRAAQAPPWAPQRTPIPSSVREAGCPGGTALPIDVRLPHHCPRTLGWDGARRRCTSPPPPPDARGVPRQEHRRRRGAPSRTPGRFRRVPTVVVLGPGTAYVPAAPGVGSAALRTVGLGGAFWNWSRCVP